MATPPLSSTDQNDLIKFADEDYDGLESFDILDTHQISMPALSHPVKPPLFSPKLSVIAPQKTIQTQFNPNSVLANKDEVPSSQNPAFQPHQPETQMSSPKPSSIRSTDPDQVQIQESSQSSQPGNLSLPQKPPQLPTQVQSNFQFPIQNQPNPHPIGINNPVAMAAYYSRPHLPFSNQPSKVLPKTFKQDSQHEPPTRLTSRKRLLEQENAQEPHQINEPAPKRLNFSPQCTQTQNSPDLDDLFNEEDFNALSQIENLSNSTQEKENAMLHLVNSAQRTYSAQSASVQSHNSPISQSDDTNSQNTSPLASPMGERTQSIVAKFGVNEQNHLPPGPLRELLLTGGLHSQTLTHSPVKNSSPTLDSAILISPKIRPSSSSQLSGQSFRDQDPCISPIKLLAKKTPVKARVSAHKRTSPSSKSNVEDSFVFRLSPWLEALHRLQLPPFYPENCATLEYSIEYITTRGFHKKVPSLLCLVTSLKMVDENAHIVVRDPTGEMEGSINKHTLDLYDCIDRGCVLLLRDVSVLSLSRTRHSLVIIPMCVVDVIMVNVHFPPKAENLDPHFDPREPYKTLPELPKLVLTKGRNQGKQSLLPGESGLKNLASTSKPSPHPLNTIPRPPSTPTTPYRRRGTFGDKPSHPNTGTPSRSQSRPHSQSQSHPLSSPYQSRHQPKVTTTTTSQSPANIPIPSRSQGSLTFRSPLRATQNIIPSSPVHELSMSAQALPSAALNQALSTSSKSRGALLSQSSTAATPPQPTSKLFAPTSTINNIPNASISSPLIAQSSAGNDNMKNLYSWKR